MRAGGALVRERLHTQLRRLFHQLRGVGSLLAYEIRELIIIVKKKKKEGSFQFPVIPSRQGDIAVGFMWLT